MWNPRWGASTLAAGVGLIAVLTMSRVTIGGQKTTENLQIAYIEATAVHAKYEAYSFRADRDGYPGVARLFRGTAESERITSENFRGLLAQVGIFQPTAGRYDGDPRDTRTNLRDAVMVEQDESGRIYPGMVRAARAEGQWNAAHLLGYAVDSAARHAALFEGALQRVGDLPDTGPYLICPVCGATYASPAPVVCSSCGLPREQFQPVF